MGQHPALTNYYCTPTRSVASLSFRELFFFVVAVDETSSKEPISVQTTTTGSNPVGHLHCKHRCTACYPSSTTGTLRALPGKPPCLPPRKFPGKIRKPIKNEPKSCFACSRIPLRVQANSSKNKKPNTKKSGNSCCSQAESTKIPSAAWVQAQIMQTKYPACPVEASQQTGL